MKRWSDLADEVAAYVRGCPAPLAETAAREAVERFCLESHAWTDAVSDLEPPAEGEPLYVMPPDASGEIIAVEAATQGGHPVRNVRLDPPESLHGDFRPDGDPVEVRVALKPSPQGYGIPDWIWAYWGRQIRHGAVAYLLELPGREWTSYDVAQHYWRTFQSGVSNARIRKAKGYTGRDTQVRPRPFI